MKLLLTIAKKYQGKNLFMAFPILDSWCLIEHDTLVKLIDNNTNWLNTDSWLVNRMYSSASPSKRLIQALRDNILNAT